MRTTTKQLRVLVIEDNDDHWVLIEKAIQKSLGEVGVSRIASPADAEAFLKKCSVEEGNMPSLILQDLYLPSLDDGLTLVKHVKAMPTSHRKIPIVMLSSSDVQIDINSAYEAGISSYCLKPTNIEDWISLFKTLNIYWLETTTLPLQPHSLS